jgi:hypothetical protein
MLVVGYEGLLQRRASMPANNRSALGHAAQWLVQLYQDWGKPEKVAEWRGKTQLAKATALEQIR